MSDAGWGIVFVLVLAVAVAALIALVVWQSFKVWQTRITTGVAAAHDESYRKLAEDATAAQRAIAEDQRTIAGDLAEVRSRVTAIETLLREVG